MSLQMKTEKHVYIVLVTVTLCYVGYCLEYIYGIPAGCFFFPHSPTNVKNRCVCVVDLKLQSVYSDGNIAENVNLFEWDYTRVLHLCCNLGTIRTSGTCCRHEYCFTKLLWLER